MIEKWKSRIWRLFFAHVHIQRKVSSERISSRLPKGLFFWPCIPESWQKLITIFLADHTTVHSLDNQILIIHDEITVFSKNPRRLIRDSSPLAYTCVSREFNRHFRIIRRTHRSRTSSSKWIVHYIHYTFGSCTRHDRVLRCPRVMRDTIAEKRWLFAGHRGQMHGEYTYR